MGQNHPSATVSVYVEVIKGSRNILRSRFFATGFDILHSVAEFDVIGSDYFPTAETSYRYNHEITCTTSASWLSHRFLRASSVACALYR